MPAPFDENRNGRHPSREPISRRLLLLIASIAFCLACSAPVSTLNTVPSEMVEQTNASRPNIVFVLTDDQRSDAVGYAENPLLGIETPHIDRLAAEGARFDNMFVTTSLCSPSRASFLSGLYAHAHGVTNNFTDYPADLASFPRQLNEEGYATAYIGKWHMGEGDDSRRPGFDYWITHKGQGKYYDTTFNVDGERQVVHGYYSERVTDMALEWLEEQTQTQPFMLIVGHKAPHGPFVPEKKYSETYDGIPVPYPSSAFALEGKPHWIVERLATWHGIYGPLYGFRENFPDERPEAVSDFERFVRSYTATINSVDDSVGRLYAALEASGQLDNTIFVFASDNGFLLGEHGMIDKRTMHEASIRVPLAVRYPAAIEAGTVIDEQVLSIDVAPSLLALAGARPLENIHGASWAGLLDTENEEQDRRWRKSWHYAYDYEKQFPYTPNVRGVRTDRWKYVRYPHGDGGEDRHLAELYDLQSDPGERTNLIASPSHRDRAKSLARELEARLATTGALPDPMPLDQGIQSELPEESIR